MGRDEREGTMGPCRLWSSQDSFSQPSGREMTSPSHRGSGRGTACSVSQWDLNPGQSRSGAGLPFHHNALQKENWEQRSESVWRKTGRVPFMEAFGGGGEGIACLQPGLLHPPPLRLGQGCLHALNFLPGVQTHAPDDQTDLPAVGLSSHQEVANAWSLCHRVPCEGPGPRAGPGATSGRSQGQP